MTRKNILWGVVVFIMANSALLMSFSVLDDRVVSGFHPLGGFTMGSLKANIFIFFNLFYFILFWKKCS